MLSNIEQVDSLSRECMGAVVEELDLAVSNEAVTDVALEILRLVRSRFVVPTPALILIGVVSGVVSRPDVHRGREPWALVVSVELPVRTIDIMRTFSHSLRYRTNTQNVAIATARAVDSNTDKATLGIHDHFGFHCTGSSYQHIGSIRIGDISPRPKAGALCALDIQVHTRTGGSC